MKLVKQYIVLREHYSHIKEAEEVFVTVDELADILECTHRNVMLLLHRMSDQDWLQWTPKRGRGNRSCLMFIAPMDQMTITLTKRLVEKRDLRGALEQINAAAVSPTTREQFHHWLHSSFGFQSEVTSRNVKIDTLRLPLSGPLHSFDPLQTNFASESHLVKQIFDSLVQFNALTQTIEPHLAHFWDVDDTRTLWTFYLRKGVLFHHGRAMTANDVKYSLLRAKHSAERSLYRWVYKQIKRIEIFDPNTLRIQLDEPNELFLSFLSTYRTSIVPQEICEPSLDRFGRNPVGTGPFKLLANDRSMCVLEAYPYYFQGRAHVDRVEIWNIPDLYDQEHHVQLENFQIIHNVKISKNTSSLDQVKQAGTTCKFITFNSLKTGIIQDQRLRYTLINVLNSVAVSNALNDDSILELNGFLTDTKNEVSQSFPPAKYQYDKLELCTIPHYERDALLIQSFCKEVGIQVEVTLLTPEEFRGEKRLLADIILFAIVLDQDRELRLIDLYKSMQLHLEPAMSRTVDTLIMKILSEASAAQRKIHFQEIELHLKKKVWIHFLYQKQQRTVYHHSIKGIGLDSLGWVQFKDIWFNP